jgi:prepilin-type N-terminal cleavage/methylation domain-containing protein
MNQRSGFSIVELLISMGILGVLLSLLSSFLISNQKVTTDQITHVTLENDTRLAFLRMSEVLSQAQYIFPADQTLVLDGQNFTTGSRAIAVLIPAGTTYCQGKTKTYCGFAFTIEDRGPFKAMLGPNNGTSGLALIETRVQNLKWDQEVVPTLDADLSKWSSKGIPNDFRRSPITDSIKDSQTNLILTSKTATYSDFDTDKFDFNQNDDTNYSDDLLLAVESKLSLERSVRGRNLSIDRTNFVFSRAIPRSGLPD